MKNENRWSLHDISMYGVGSRSAADNQALVKDVGLWNLVWFFNLSINGKNKLDSPFMLVGLEGSPSMVMAERDSELLMPNKLSLLECARTMTLPDFLAVVEPVKKQLHNMYESMRYDVVWEVNRDYKLLEYSKGLKEGKNVVHVNFGK